MAIGVVAVLSAGKAAKVKAAIDMMMFFRTRIVSAYAIILSLCNDGNPSVFVIPGRERRAPKRRFRCRRYQSTKTGFRSPPFLRRRHARCGRR